MQNYCRSRRELSRECLLAIIGVDTAAIILSFASLGALDLLGALEGSGHCVPALRGARHGPRRALPRVRELRAPGQLRRLRLMRSRASSSLAIVAVVVACAGAVFPAALGDVAMWLASLWSITVAVAARIFVAVQFVACGSQSHLVSNSFSTVQGRRHKL